MRKIAYRPNVGNYDNDGNYDYYLFNRITRVYPSFKCFLFIENSDILVL